MFSEFSNFFLSIFRTISHIFPKLFAFTSNLLGPLCPPLTGKGLQVSRFFTSLISNDLFTGFCVEHQSSLPLAETRMLSSSDSGLVDTTLLLLLSEQDCVMLLL